MNIETLRAIEDEIYTDRPETFMTDAGEQRNTYAAASSWAHYRGQLALRQAGYDGAKTVERIEAYTAAKRAVLRELGWAK